MKRKLIAIAAVLLAVAVAFGWWKWAQLQQWKWEPIVMHERLARVPQTWEVSTLARAMEESKKLRDANTFKVAAAKIGLTKIAPGGYLLPEKAGPADLAKIFSQPPSHLKITFPEGWTGALMSTRLAKAGFANAKAFRDLVYPPGQPISSLEGELFPDTYWLPVKSTAPQIASRLHGRFQEIAASLPRPFPLGYQGKRLTLKEVTILASLVERETDVPSERALVAGVLLKRMRDRMRLQCDASVQYALQRDAARNGINAHQSVLRRDYKFVSPYNTYLNYGLPPGAICNPGRKALHAAARPQETEYLFYVWSPKLKRHRFSKTYSEHLHNVALAKLEKS